MKKEKNKGLFYQVYVIEKSLKHHIVEWCATAATLSGALLISTQSVNGFYILIIGNVLWGWFSGTHKHYGLLLTNCLLALINIIGIVTWN